MGNSASTIASTLVTKDEAQAKYQPKGSYLTPTTAASTYLASTDAKATYLASADAKATYLASADAKATYLASADAKATYLASADAPSKTLWCADGSCKVPTGSKNVVFPSGDPATLGKPTATGSSGARVVMWGDGSKYFYGAGVDTNTLWMSTDTPNGIFKFYNQDKEVANISGTGINAPTFTATGSVITPQLTASGAVTAGSVSTAGAINAGSFTTTGAINTGSVTATGAINAGSVTASGLLSAGALNATGNITTSSAVNAKDIVASGTVTAPNIYDRATVDAAITKATQNIVSSGQASNLSTMDINPKSITTPGGIRVGNWMLRDFNGLLQFVRVNADGSLVDGTKGNVGYVAFAPDGNLEIRRNALDGQSNWIADRYFWHRGDGVIQSNGARINGELTVNSIRLGKWILRDAPDGSGLEIFRDGVVNGRNAANAAYFWLTNDGNINMRRYAKQDDVGSGFLADQFVRYDRPFAIQSSRGDYLSNTDNFGAGFRGRPSALTNWETMVARKPFGADFAPVADDKPFTDTKALFKSTAPPATSGGGSYGGAI